MGNDDFDDLLRIFLKNRKKYLGCFLGFLLGLLLVTVGFVHTVFVIIMTILGCVVVGNKGIIGKTKKMLYDYFKDK